MDQLLIDEIAQRVSAEIDLQVAVIGICGVIIGGIISIIGNVIIYRMQNKQQKNIDEARKGLLQTMLDDPKFKEGRSFEELSKVTGTVSQPDECRKLLIGLNARGFTLEDGREAWGYIKNKPLSQK